MEVINATTNWTLKRVRFTKNGKGLYKDNEGHNIYLDPDEMAELDNPVLIVVAIRKKVNSRGQNE